MHFFLDALRVKKISSIGCLRRCRSQCTRDGRPYSTLAGTGGQRAAVLDDNVLCNSEDPYNSQENILVHEYAHTIKAYGLSSSQKQRVSLNIDDTVKPV